MSFDIYSDAFVDGGMIPIKHTCDRQGLSPRISWDDVPEGTKSLALICEDPDAPAGASTHWLLYNIPPEQRELPEGIEKSTNLFDGMMQGTNDFRQWGYAGPCPPEGPAHRYHFRLYALDGRLNLGAGVLKSDVERAMKGHVLAETVLIGMYGR